MEDMVLHDKLTWDLEANWKVVIDGFNENYHAAHLHTISPQDVKDGRFSTYFVFGRNGMMVIPLQGRAAGAERRPRDHQGLAICHYTIFPTSVFNNNPAHLQLFRAVPIAVDRTRFETWELWYADGDDEYLEKTGAHWERLKGVVAEDVGDLPGVGGRPPVHRVHAERLQQPRMQDHSFPPRRAGHARRQD